MTALCVLTAQAHLGSAKGRALLEALTRSLGRDARVCYIGAPHGDSPGFTGREVQEIERLGFRCDVPRLTDPKLDRGAAREAITSADVLYLSGGDTVAFVETVRACDLMSAFADAHARARIIYGVSGGTCAMAPHTIGYGDGDAPYLAPCFGFGAHAALDVHDEKENWPEMRALLKLMHAQHPALDPVGLVIPSGSALIITPEGEAGSLGKKPCELRRLDARWRWQVEPLPPTTMELPA